MRGGNLCHVVNILFVATSESIVDDREQTLCIDFSQLAVTGNLTVYLAWLHASYNRKI